MPPAWREASARRRALLAAVLQVLSGEEGRQASAECHRCARDPTPVRAMGPTRHPLAPQVYLVSSELMAPAGRVPVLVLLAPGKPELRGPLASWAGGAGAGADRGKGDEKEKRRKYTPFRVEDDDELPEGYVNPMSQTYGTDKDIAPAPRRDDGWDPRQW